MLPVFEVDFWKKRLRKAQTYGILRDSVAVFPRLTWQTHEMSMKYAAQNVKSGEKVLDFGCGYGRNAFLFPKEDYVGVDIVPEFIEIAKNENPGYSFMVGDIRKLPFKDKEFDWAIGVSMKQMIRGNYGEEVWNDIEKELRRVAKKLMIVEYDEDQPTII